MSLISSGGSSFPNIVFIILLAIPFILSLCLNPLVFIYNTRKKNTAPRFLYKILAILDSLSCFIIPINSIYKISLHEDPKCYFLESHQMYWCEAYYSPIKWWERVVSALMYTLIVTPNCVLATLATVRYLQIRNPFCRIRLRYTAMFIGVYLIYTITVFAIMFADKLAYYLSLSQSVENIFLITRDHQLTQGMKSLVTTTLLSWGPCFLCQLISMVCSILAVIQLYLYSSSNRVILPESQKSGRSSQVNNGRANIRIFTANAGGLIYTVLHLVWYFGLSDWKTSETQVICFFVYNNILPLYLSCLNPAIFISFTDDFVTVLKGEKRGTVGSNGATPFREKMINRQITTQVTTASL